VLASVRDAGNEVREIRATGGFARSDLWRQMLADALGMPIGFPAGHEGSAFGAALLAMDALGLVDGIERARNWWTSTTSSSPGGRGRRRLRGPAAHLRLALLTR
jgi:sugar (pentulose or hexulose) kinase